MKDPETDPRPFADICPFCNEPIAPTDRLDNTIQNVRVHWECGFRAVMGGVNHIRKICTCCGGTDDPDPPGMTRREAARAALDEWLRQAAVR